MKFVWSRDPYGGLTGIVEGQWKAYVLSNGTWTLFRWGSLKHHATGKAPSVISARAAVAKAASNQEHTPCTP